ncbi:hypothetical protein [Actinomadura litoris]|uniref:hypothetical protein n=1 Tax=Actinomadura litoris TaxID=2678616 RepID=UPI001FA72343|nr:hypothetical protein [Actinomadura litoris]
MTRGPRPPLAAIDTHTCLKCGRPLHASKEWFVGDDCAKNLGPDRGEALRIYAVQEADPFTSPRTGQRPMSPQARLNIRNAHAAAKGIGALCRHLSEIGRCGACREAGKSENASKRILREVRAQPQDRRRTERAALQAARLGPQHDTPATDEAVPGRPQQIALR